MPTTVPVNYAEATLFFTIPGDAGPANIVLSLRPALPTVEFEVYMDAIETSWQANFSPRQASTTTLTYIQFSFMTVDGLLTDGKGYSTPGTNIGPGLPPNVSYVMNKITTLGGRKGRGRMFIPGAVETEVTDAGQLPSGTITSLTAAGGQFLSDLAAADMEMVLFHPLNDPIPTTVTNLRPASKIGQQRRRLR